MLRVRGAGSRLSVTSARPACPTTLDLLEHAGGAGVDAVMVLPPFFFRNVTVAGLDRFFVAVPEASRVPVLMHHFPAIQV
jgi:4-hydroxy-tetrahydrodipicolinate synthase